MGQILEGTDHCRLATLSKICWMWDKLWEALRRKCRKKLRVNRRGPIWAEISGNEHDTSQEEQKKLYGGTMWQFWSWWRSAGVELLKDILLGRMANEEEEWMWLNIGWGWLTDGLDRQRNVLFLIWPVLGRYRFMKTFSTHLWNWIEDKFGSSIWNELEGV